MKIKITNPGDSTKVVKKPMTSADIALMNSKAGMGSSSMGKMTPRKEQLKKDVVEGVKAGVRYIKKKAKEITLPTWESMK
jgi:hypothetical protein